ncbi:MAG: hypothetical protein ABI652_02285 [Acidobacteriota bacterium]
MNPTRTLVLAAVGAGCIVAAGAGGFLAVRMGTADPAAAPAFVSAPESLGVPPAPVTTVQSAPQAVESATKSTARAALARQKSKPATTTTLAPPARTAANPKSITSSPKEPSGPVVAAPPVSSGVSQAVSTTAAAAVPQVAAASEAAVAPTEPALPQLDELVVAGNSVIGIRLDTAVSTETARVEDRVSARVTRDVAVAGRTAIPSGTRLEGAVSTVQRGGKFKERARLGIRFTTVLLPDGTRMPIQTETIFRDGDAPGNEASAKIGASAVVGAILGAVVGGKKGAAIGGTAGAAGGTAAVMASDANAAVIPAGTPLTVRLTSPLTVVVEHEQ